VSYLIFLYTYDFSFAGYRSLSGLRNLKIMDLSTNYFNYSTFPFLNAATSLTTLILTYNEMDGPFPIKGVFFDS